MMQKKTQTVKKVFSLMLVLVMMIGIITPGSATVVKAEAPAHLATLEKATKCLNNKVEPVFGSEWVVIQQARQSDPDKKWLHFYHYNIMDYLKDKNNVQAMTVAQTTKVILALEAIGDDPTDVNGVNLFSKFADFTQFDNEYSSVYDVPTMAYILLASSNFNDAVFKVDTVSDDKQTTKEKLVNKILSYYDKDQKCWGGPDWYTGVWTPDPDITAQALQGLSLFGETNEEVVEVINNSMTSLEKLIDENGCVSSYGYPNACSTAQVVCAYVSLGKDPDYKKEDGKSLIDGLCSFFDETTGGILDYTGTQIDLEFNTVQAGYALAAYDRYYKSSTSNFIFDMSDVSLGVPRYVCDAHVAGEDKEIIRNATCTAAGKKAVVCRDCGEIINKDDIEEISALGHTGGEATCSERAICDRCGQEYGELNPNKHGKTEIKNAKEPTCTEKGYTGDKVCSQCGEILEKGKEIAAKGHTPVEIPAIPATETTPGKTAGKKCSVCGEVIEAPKDIPATGKKEGPVQQTVEATPQFVSDGYEADGSKLTYKDDNDSTAKKLVIPATIKEDGKTYKVTKIAAGACKGNKNLTSVSVGKNVTSIGKKAFNGCSKLKTITIKGKVTSVGKNAFAGISKKATIKIKASKKQYKKTVKLIKKSGIPKTVKFKRV